MKIGICTWSFTNCHAEAGQPLDPFIPDDLARMAADCGLSSIECAPGPILDKSPAELDAFKQFLADHQLDIFIDTGGSNYAEDITPLRTALEAARQVGARAVRTTISSMLEGDRTQFGLDGWKAHLQSLVDPFKSIMPLAAECNIPIGLENHQDASSWELIQLIEQVGSPLLGVTMDVANALAVGETPEAFAQRVMPFLKHVHFKDYTIHPTPSGYRFKRCAVGDGVVDWPAVVALFKAGAPDVQGCIELGASQARHVRILERDYWSTYPDRPLSETIDAIRTLHQAARPPEEDWRTPHEREESMQARATYEMEQFERSVAYIGKNL
jgi:3-oxoisoapionate decarboxylase